MRYKKEIQFRNVKFFIYYTLCKNNATILASVDYNEINASTMVTKSAWYEKRPGWEFPRSVLVKSLSKRKLKSVFVEFELIFLNDSHLWHLWRGAGPGRRGSITVCYVYSNFRASVPRLLPPPHPTFQGGGFWEGPEDGGSILGVLTWPHRMVDKQESTTPRVQPH